MTATPFHAYYTARILDSLQDDDKFIPTFASSDIKVYPYQVGAALFATRSPYTKGVVLMDESGLGKSTEATWLPEGTEFVTSFDNGDGETFIYTNEREMVVQFTYTTGMNSKLFVGAENYEERKATVNGMDADIYISPTDDETSAIVWKDNSIPMLFNFSADCSPEELIKAAECVRVKE